MSSLRRGDRGLPVTEIRVALAALGLVDDPEAELTTGLEVSGFAAASATIAPGLHESTVWSVMQPPAARSLHP